MIRRHLVLFVLVCLAGCASPRPSEPVPAAPAAPVAPPERPTFTQTGLASWYGSNHQGQPTANGERYDTHAMTAAHRELPFHTIVRVTGVESGKVVKVRINDRGPKVKDRIIDLSAAAGAALGIRDNGVLMVRIEVFASDQSP